jgi:hypothetical protein
MSSRSHQTAKLTGAIQADTSQLFYLNRAELLGNMDWKLLAVS